MNSVSPVRSVSRLRAKCILAFSVVFPALPFAMLIMGFAFWVAPWKADFGLSQGQIMVAYTVGALVMTASFPLVGRLLDRVPIRSAVVSGAALMAAGLTLVAMAQSFWQVLALYATILPAGTALAGSLPAQTLLVRLFPRHTGLVSGAVTTGVALGGVAMAALTPHLLAAASWRGTFLIVAGVLAFLIAPLAWFILNVPPGAPARELRRNESKSSMASEATRPGNQGAALTSPVFWLLVVATLSPILPLAALPPHLVVITTDTGLDARAGASLVSAYALAAACGNLGGGWLVDRLDYRLVYFGISAVMAISVILFATQLALPGLCVAAAALGFAGGSVGPWSAAMVARRFGAVAFARVFGLVNLFFVPAPFFAVLVGWLHDRSGSYQSSYIGFVVLLVPGVLSASLLKRNRVSAEAS